MRLRDSLRFRIATFFRVTPPGFHGTWLIYSPALFIPIVNQEQTSLLKSVRRCRAGACSS